MFLISDLCELLDKYLDKEQVAEVYRAYVFGAEAHEGQRRMSGEPYIYHPIAVARILAEMHMDSPTIVAAILHDVIEDTATAKDQLINEFSEEVAELVDGVSKLTQVEFESKAEEQAENFRKMLLAMAKDIRVVIIKLADRLHNMRTLGVMRPDKRRRIAHETLEIYSPIANRLGMNTIRLELEDLGFIALYPMRYRVIDEGVKNARGNRKEIVKKIETAIKRRIRQEGLSGKILGRQKHLYSIYKKMRDKKLPFAEVFDVYAFRIVVDKPDSCYRILGVMHNLYKPVPGKFKDYIAIPKANGYQSIHTVLFGPFGVHIEVQIRTEEMNKVAEAGIAAHWLYKSGDNSSNAPQQRAREWLRELLEMQKGAGDSLEFLENVKVDLFPDEVYVFSPKGKIMEMPRGATAVDFAYAVHTDVGNNCVAAKIDRRLSPLRTELLNGQTVDIITAPGAKPNPSWLNFVVTAKARANIRHYLKNLKQDDAIALGRRLLDKSLGEFALSLDKIDPSILDMLLAEYHIESLNELLEDIGLGNRLSLLVARALAPEQEGELAQKVTDNLRPLAIRGTEGLLVNFARCCRPIPGDPILGFVSAGRGIVIHNEHCKNVAEYKNLPEKWIDVQWEHHNDNEFPVDLRVEVANRRGVLATVAATISDMDVNIENVEIKERDGLTSTLRFTVDVKDRDHLANIMRNVKRLDMVARINRVRG